MKARCGNWLLGCQVARCLAGNSNFLKLPCVAANLFCSRFLACSLSIKIYLIKNFSWKRSLRRNLFDLGTTQQTLMDSLEGNAEIIWSALPKKFLLSVISEAATTNTMISNSVMVMSGSHPLTTLRNFAAPWENCSGPQCWEEGHLKESSPSGIWTIELLYDLNPISSWPMLLVFVILLYSILLWCFSKQFVQ